jgi:hypothetical protein
MKATATHGRADDVSGAASTTGRLWPIPVAGDYLETLTDPLDGEWVLAEPDRRFGCADLPAGAGPYESALVLEVKPEVGVLLVATSGGAMMLRYFAECRWFTDTPWTTTAETREEGTGALLFRGHIELEIGNGSRNMRRAAELVAALNRHGVVLASDGERA